ncbi:MAG TPA: hypothetical protein VIN03_00650 [Roseateles sp.]
MNVLRRCLCVCGLVCAAVHADELPRTSACRTALQALEQAEDAIAASAAASAPADQERRRAVAAQLQPLRQRVADACLGGLTTSPPPSQHTWIAAPAPRTAAAIPRVPMPATPLPTVPPPRFEMPSMVTHCTAAACFTSDGTTLTRVGPSLVGPRGACTVQGSFVRCP